MSTVIPPTPGRMVWYRAGRGDDNIALFNTQGQDRPDPLAAIVAGVDHIRNVNLAVMDANGFSFVRQNILLLQPGDDLPSDGRPYAEWMPFQKGQAKQAETRTYSDGTTAVGVAPLPKLSPLEQESAANAGRAPIMGNTPISVGEPGERMSFGAALERLKGGARIARTGWNGKNMFVYLNEGAFDGAMLGFMDGGQPGANHPSTIDGVSLGLFEAWNGGITTRMPNINMHAASGVTVTGWLASQTDMLAEDWIVAP